LKKSIAGIIVGFALTVLAGCQSTGGVSSSGETTFDPNDPSLDMSEVFVVPADRRTRAKSHADLAAAYFDLGNLGVALEETRIALKADPTYAPGYNIQGLVMMELRETASAEQSFQRGLQLAPDDSDLNHNYGVFLCKNNRSAEAIPRFMRAVRNPLYQAPAKSYTQAGLCLAKENPTEAAVQFERALKLDPFFVPALVPYAELKYQRGELGEARALLTRYVKQMAEPSGDALWLGVRTEHTQGDNAAEASYATPLRNRFPGSPQVKAMQAGQFD